MKTRRPSGSLLLSVAVHAVIAVVLLNMAFHYDIISLPRSNAPEPTVERITYVRVAPIAGGGAVGGASTGEPAKAERPNTGLVAPPSVPTSVAAPQPAAGTPGGVAGGTGSGGGVGPTTGIVPGVADPRLSVDPRQWYPVPKTQAQRTDSAIQAIIFAYNDSVAKASGGRKPGDWTFEKGGGKWGVDGSKIYLGKFAIPSAVLAALPLRIQGNPGERLNDRLVGTRAGEVAEHAASQYHDLEFKDAVKRIRERKDRERQERLAAQGRTTDP
ncbi:MAG TPA: hypothetical protein VFY85_14145 [Gemmatimonadaceae bacterium]|nr:hypothetical protein [Gemmatimonadaceae bacterium]